MHWVRTYARLVLALFALVGFLLLSSSVPLRMLTTRHVSPLEAVTLAGHLQASSDEARYRTYQRLAAEEAEVVFLVSTIAERMQTGEPWERPMLADLLGLAGPDALPLIEFLLRDNRAEIRRHALFALGKMGSEAINRQGHQSSYYVPFPLELIEARLSDENAKVRSAAQAVLRLLGLDDTGMHAQRLTAPPRVLQLASRERPDSARP